MQITGICFEQVFGQQRRWCQWISQLLAQNEELDNSNLRLSIESTIIEITECNVFILSVVHNLFRTRCVWVCGTFGFLCQ